MPFPPTLAPARTQPFPRDLLGGRDADIALLTDAGALDYSEVRARVHEVATAIGAGRRLVLVAGENRLDAVIGYLAALCAGHVVILAAPQQMDGLIERYRPDTVLVGGDSGVDVRTLHAHPAHRLHPDLSLLLSTSGSTGSPKLVRLSWGSVRSNALSIGEYLQLTPRDRAASTLPMHYTYGLSVLHSHLAAGASVRLTERSVVDEEFWGAFVADGCTSLAGVPHTFDLLDASGFAEREVPGLRYLTQAGGRLREERVRAYAALGARRGFELFVMYGQTEATARMAYLPPELAREHPAAIGRAIPGGRLRLHDPGPDGVGELVYQGPNVMLGYAETAADLARGRDADELFTGDLARCTRDGLFEIVGRRNRFAKVFGVRIDLERVERILEDAGVDARAIEHDEHVAVAVRYDRQCARVRQLVAAATGLPAHRVMVFRVAEFPLTPSGKPDRVALAAHAAQFGDEMDASGGAAGIRELYARLLDRPDATVDDSFTALDGDSLNYVEVSIALERVLERLPEDWPDRTPRQLAADAGGQTVGTHAGPRRLSSVETPLLLRTIAIVLVVATHANVLSIQGGAHLLLAVLGVNLARFRLTGAPRRDRGAGLARSAAQIAVPAVLWIGLVALVSGLYQPATVGLLNGVLGDSSAWSPQWHFWFLEAALWAIAGIAVLVGVPALDRWERARPFVFAMAVLGLALVVRFAVLGGAQAVSLERFLPGAVLWLVAVGWAAARATTVAQRLLVTAVTLVAVLGFFGQLSRELVVLVGVLVIIWVPTIPVPRFLLPVVQVLAASSLFVYLVHWQVYPWLEDDLPLVATVASFAAGIAAWQVYRIGRRVTRRVWSRFRRVRG